MRQSHPLGDFRRKQKQQQSFKKTVKALVFDKQTTNVFLIISHLNEYLSIKGVEQLRVPSSWLVNLAIDIVKTVRSIVEDSGDYMKGPSQVGASLCGFC